MEKVKIKTCVDTGKKTKKDSPIIEIQLIDGRKGTGFDEKLKSLKENDEIEFEIKPISDYNGEKRFWFLLPNQGENKKGNFQKDWTLEKKKIALESALKYHTNSVHGHEDIILKSADIFFNWLNQKS